MGGLVLLASALSAQTLAEAARQLASIVPAHTRVAVAIENRAGLDDARVEEFRAALVEQLEVAADGTPLRAVLAENVRGPLAIVQFGQKTVMSPWVAEGTPAPRARARITSTLVWRQSEPVLDALITPESLLVLEPARLVLYRRDGDSWRAEKNVVLNWPSPMPRDPRGRLSGTLEQFQVLTPAGACSGKALPQLSCAAANVDNPWVAGRNLQRHQTFGEFYSAAELPDGKAVTAGPGSSVRGIGSQVAAVTSKCGVAWLASSPAVSASDSLTGMNAAGEPSTDPLSVDGVVKELWTNGGAVTAIVHRARQYEILQLAIACPE